jgi:hypothetical protein
MFLVGIAHQLADALQVCLGELFKNFFCKCIASFNQSVPPDLKRVICLGLNLKPYQLFVKVLQCLHLPFYLRFTLFLHLSSTIKYPCRFWVDTDTILFNREKVA